MGRSPPSHNPLRRRHFRCSGFLLMDALVAMTVLAIGFTSIIHLQAQILALNGRTKSQAEALRLAEGKLEQMRYATLQSLAGDWSTEGEQSTQGSNTTYQLLWDTRKTAAPDVWNFTVTTSWQTTNSTRNITLGGSVAGIEPLATNLWSASGR